MESNQLEEVHLSSPQDAATYLETVLSTIIHSKKAYHRVARIPQSSINSQNSALQSVDQIMQETELELAQFLATLKSLDSSELKTYQNSHIFVDFIRKLFGLIPLSTNVEVELHQLTHIPNIRFILSEIALSLGIDIEVELRRHIDNYEKYSH
ncbi:hypothetical protein KKC94_01980 [Patescibacteria group bacterium]|nr:hypothetical protein [Patescibacteria group bacterium]